MSCNKFAAVFRSILLLGLASGTAWANHAIVSYVRIEPGQPVPIAQGHHTASGDLWPCCAWVSSSCRTGSFDAILRQNHAVVTHDAQVATAEFPSFSPKPSRRSGEKLGVVSSGPSRPSLLPRGGNHSDSTLIHTGVFPGAGEKFVDKGPIGQVQTGVFEGPGRFLDEAQGDNPRNAPRLGFWALPVNRGSGTATEDSQPDQGRPLEKKGWGHRIWSRSRRDR
jgi:hypothetical protein